MNGSDFSYVPAAERLLKSCLLFPWRGSRQIETTPQAFNPFVAYDID